MRGEVQIWAGDELLHQEPNLIVDGAGEVLADIMTVSRSLSGIEDHATSSILDASNYTIQAISFGTGSDAFRNNAHVLTDGKRSLLETLYGFFVSSIIPVPSVVVNYPLDASSYYPEVGLPATPNPANRTLDFNTNVSAVVGGVAVSSVFPGNGQITNFMPSAIMSSVCEGTIFSSTASAHSVASVMGAFPEGSGTGFTQQTKNYTYAGDGTNFAWSPSNRSGSYFNEASSMDVSGFVNMIMSSVAGPGYSSSSSASGLILSATGPDFHKNGLVVYEVTLAADDIALANSYGGIYSFGLWTIDMKQCLLNGNTPPFAFSVLNNPRKYKLFCFKGLSKNLAYIQDNGTDPGDYNYKDLKLQWRLYFQ